MKIAKLVLGIISIIASQLIAFQSQTVYYLETFTNTLNDAFGSTADLLTTYSGLIGLFFAYAILCSGIISVACLKSKLGTTINAFIFLVAGLVAVIFPTIYTDLFYYGIVSILFSIGYIVIFVFQYQNEKTEYDKHDIRNWL